MPDVDLSEFKALGRRSQRKPCGVAEAVNRAPAKDRRKLLAAFDSDDLDIRRGARSWMRAREIEPPNDSAVSYHRRGGCACHD